MNDEINNDMANEPGAETNNAPEMENISSIKSEEAQAQKRTRIIVVASLSILIAVVLLLYFFGRTEQNGAGRPVPAPRNTSFGESNNSQTSQFSGEQTIMIEPEPAARAGIKTEAVGEALASETGSTTASSTGVVEANAYRETRVMALAGGVVRQINAELGQPVERGQTVAMVFSQQSAAAQSRVVSLFSELDAARKNYEREAKLVKLNPVSRGELDEATTKLKTATAMVEEHHQHHERTRKLVAIGAASREEFEQATTRLKTSEAELSEAHKRFDRATQLVDINPVSRAAFDQATAKLKDTEAELAAAKQQLLLLGFSQQRVNALVSQTQISSEIAVTAPISGTITARSANVGEVVETNKELLRVTDLSSVWVIGQVYEKDLGKIRVGSGASITSDAYPGKLFRGNIAYVDPSLDEATRTAKVRIELLNPGQMLKIGMYVNVAFANLGGSANTTAVIPVSAVQTLFNQPVVFTATDQTNVFALRQVRLGIESKGFYPVLAGLAVGERIVTEGSFLLRAEWLKLHPTGSQQNP